MAKPRKCPYCTDGLIKRFNAKSCLKCYLYNQEVPKSPLLKNPPTMKGSCHPRWKGGKLLYAKKVVLERDKFTCKNCGLVDRDIAEVAHIKSVSEMKGDKPSWYSRRYDVQDVNNLIVLCPNCHARYDKGLIKDTGHLKPS